MRNKTWKDDSADKSTYCSAGIHSHIADHNIDPGDPKPSFGLHGNCIHMVHILSILSHGSVAKSA